MSCSVGTSYEEPYFDTEDNQCTYRCYKTVPDADNVCIPCPAKTPYWDRVSESCKSCEEVYFGTRDFWSPMFEDCVEACPEELAPTDGSTTCKTCKEVNPKTPYWGVYEQKCITCKRRTEGMLCKSCGYYKPYWDEKEEQCKPCGES